MTTKGSIVALATVIILIVRHCIEFYVVNKREFEASHFNYFVNYIIIGVTVLVIAVPEGLPLAITLALTYSVKKVSHFIFNSTIRIFESIFLINK